MTDAMQSSDFVKAKGSIPTTDREGKSVTTVVVIDGEEYFKKQLTAECRDDLRLRMALYKEFNSVAHIELLIQRHA